MKLTRLEAIQDIRLGRGIQVTFVGLSEDRNGRPHTVRVIVRRSSFKGGCAVALLESSMSYKVYQFNLTGEQVLHFIRKNYDRCASVPMQEVA